MDVNETRFHLLLKEEEWLGASAGAGEDDIAWNSSCGAVSLTPRLFRFPQQSQVPLLDASQRRGSAVDGYGNWYWISEDRTSIRFLSFKSRKPVHFWKSQDRAVRCDVETGAGSFRPQSPPPLPESLSFSGLAVTAGHYLVVGVREPAGLLIFDLHAGGTPTYLLWPPDVPFVPFDMAPASDGGVWILDAVNASVWKLDRYFRVEPLGTVSSQDETPASRRGQFHPVNGSAATFGGCPPPDTISSGAAFPLDALEPVAIETVADLGLMVLESRAHEHYSTLYFYPLADCHTLEQPVTFSFEKVLEPYLDEESAQKSAHPYAVKGHDMAYVPASKDIGGGGGGTLYISDSTGNQSFAFSFDVEYDIDKKPQYSVGLLEEYLPMRLFAGKGLVAAGETVYYDTKERWLPLTAMPMHRYRESGELPPYLFDGKEPGCVWHRLFLDAYIPPGTAVRVESRAFDRKELLDTLPWQEEPKLYLRSGGSELPYYDPFPGGDKAVEGKGTWELLFQQARGRYMQIRLTLAGTGSSSPFLYALRVYYPRFSYLNEYLPAVYREDETSASFLDRFLANVEGFYTDLEGRIADARALFDVDVAAPEYLDWLAGWFGVILDPSWDESRRRLFLRHAIQLFNRRGTLAGLIRAVRLAVDSCPDDSLFEEDLTKYGSTEAASFSVRIVERFLTRKYPGVVFGDATDVVQPALSPGDEAWTPAKGAEALHRGYRSYLKRLYKNDIDDLNLAWGRDSGSAYANFQEIFLPAVRPQGAGRQEARDWERFLVEGLGFVYAPADAENPAHVRAFRDFLARRYRVVERLNEVYQLVSGKYKLSSFAAVKMPPWMPSGGQALADWIQFVSQVLPIAEKAHRFTLLVPVVTGVDGEGLRQRLEQVRRIVEIEKPAHTHVEVKPYWALFRVGEARLGLDTLPGVGSRFVPLVLDQDALGSGYLAASHPWNVTDRRIVGRDPVNYS